MRPWVVGALAALAWGGLAGGVSAQAFTPAEGDVDLGAFVTSGGATIPDLKMHYRTLGQPVSDGSGRVTNAVLLLHGTGGTGAQFLSPQFAGELFGPGQPLDTAKYFVIMPDNLGHGASSRPSDGPAAAFPEYGYADMVEAQRRMLSDGLKVDRLRLILGTSMGCMHIFVWGTTHPDAADALMPMACQPTQIVGRNRLWRTMLKDAIRSDPGWNGGNFVEQPIEGLRTAVNLLLLAGSAPMAMQVDLATPETVDGYLKTQLDRRLPALDANDLWYQVNASWDYDPSANLERMTAPTVWINSADDFINPPELGLAEQFAPRMTNVSYRLIPNSADGKGHGTHTWARFWKDDLVGLLQRTER
jgi:homoserine O-acetyltransferase